MVLIAIVIAFHHPFAMTTSTRFKLCDVCVKKPFYFFKSFPAGQAPLAKYPQPAEEYHQQQSQAFLCLCQRALQVKGEKREKKERKKGRVKGDGKQDQRGFFLIFILHSLFQQRNVHRTRTRRIAQRQKRSCHSCGCEVVKNLHFFFFQIKRIFFG